MAAEWKIVSWSPSDPLTDEKLNAMVNNSDLLRVGRLSGKYTALGVTRTEGLRIASGMVQFNSSKSSTQSRRVTFGGFFSSTCRPIVTSGTYSSAQKKIIVTLDGPGSAVAPTRDGFTIYAAAVGNTKFVKNFYVAWHALGY